MKNKILSLVACLFIASYAFPAPAANESFLLSSLRGQLSYCDSLDVVTAFKCNRDAWKNFSGQTQYNATKAGSSNLIFILNQIINLMEDPATEKKYSRLEVRQILNRLISMYKTELTSMVSNLEGEFYEVNSSEALRRSEYFISNVVSTMGGTVKKSTNGNFSYVINGKFINCTTTGAFTNCW